MDSIMRGIASRSVCACVGAGLQVGQSLCEYKIEVKTRWAGCLIRPFYCLLSWPPCTAQSLPTALPLAATFALRAQVGGWVCCVCCLRGKIISSFVP